MISSQLTPSPKKSDSVPANATVPTADLIDYSNWSASVRRQMLKALQRRQQDPSEVQPVNDHATPAKQ
ncbi:MAG: hypothetical protein AAGG51_27300 [Cyanobacteria bacterium P01_G01_bin.54]